MPISAPHPTSAPTLDPSGSDRSLVALVARGDQAAFDLLFRRHRSGVHAYALRMLRDHAAAEDVVQDVFVSAMRAIDGGQEPTHVRAWLHEIARCACIDHWRGSERRREVSYDAPDGLSGKDARRMTVSGDAALRGATDRESLALLRCAFGDLPPLQHSVLVQRELEGRSPREIADRLGISPTVVEGQLARGRRRLAVAYRELQSGERCLATRDLCETSLVRALGVRDRARVRIHLRSCNSCRRHAHELGVEPRLLDLRVLSQIGFLLPLPLLRRLPFGHVTMTGETAGGVAAGKALVGAAVLAAGGGGALVATEVHPLPKAAHAKVVEADGSTRNADVDLTTQHSRSFIDYPFSDGNEHVTLRIGSVPTASRSRSVAQADTARPGDETLAAGASGAAVGGTSSGRRPGVTGSLGSSSVSSGVTPIAIPRLAQVAPPKSVRLAPIPESSGRRDSTVVVGGGDGTADSAPVYSGVSHGKRPAGGPLTEAGEGTEPVVDPGESRASPPPTDLPAGTGDEGTVDPAPEGGTTEPAPTPTDPAPTPAEPTPPADTVAAGDGAADGSPAEAATGGA